MNAKAPLGWVRFYEQTGNTALVCRRCGISAPTLRKWVRRYEAEGLDGLQDRSRRPKTSPQQRVFAKEEQLILGLAADKTATSTLAFLDQVIAGMSFPIQRIQTDRGAEFLAYEVQARLMRERIRFHHT